MLNINSMRTLQSWVDAGLDPRTIDPTRPLGPCASTAIQEVCWRPQEVVPMVSATVARVVAETLMRNLTSRGDFYDEEECGEGLAFLLQPYVEEMLTRAADELAPMFAEEETDPEPTTDRRPITLAELKAKIAAEERSE